ncbi:MAG: nitroreductase [Bacteroidales bacterium]|nr:nitroreductase [Bacteroidales bacterium]
MEIKDAIKQRHSVRNYLDKPIEEEKVNILLKEIEKINKENDLNIQLVLNDKDAFDTMLAHYGKFTNAVNYFALVGKKCRDLEEKCGYFGEKLVLLSQMSGLNTCWVALTFSKKKNRITINEDEKLVCVICVGYGATQGNNHKIKTFEQVTKNAQNSPLWFKDGVQAALLAPTSLNQQKFCFSIENNKVRVQRKWGHYTKIDLGIVKYHFEIGADLTDYVWE